MSSNLLQQCSRSKSWRSGAKIVAACVGMCCGYLQIINAKDGGWEKSERKKKVGKSKSANFHFRLPIEKKEKQGGFWEQKNLEGIKFPQYFLMIWMRTRMFA